MDIFGKYERKLYGLIWGSKQEAKMWKTLPTSRVDYFLSKVATPHVFQVFSEVPPEFGWGPDTVVDFHSESWPDKRGADEIWKSFQSHVAVGLSKGGKQYAIIFPKSYGNDPATIVPIDAADAREMVCFPEDWEKYVEASEVGW